MEVLVGLFLLLVAAALAWFALAVWLTVRILRWPPRTVLARILSRGGPVTPAEVGLPEPAVWTVRLPGGESLPVWSWPGRGDGPITVLIHDWMGSRLEFLPSIAMFLDDSAQVVAADRAGHGDHPGSAEGGKKDLEAARLLLEYFPDASFRLVGHGLGATLALAQGAMDQLDIVEIIAVDPWKNTPGEVAHRLVKAGLVFRPPRSVLTIAQLIAQPSVPTLGRVRETVDLHIEVSDSDTADWMRHHLGCDPEVIAITSGDASSP